MKTLCGINCDECILFEKKCKGCIETEGCPFGKKCWIHKYISVGGRKNFIAFKKTLIEEINALNILGMPKIDELYPLQGSMINLEYVLPSGKKEKFLDDHFSYLGNQVECLFNEDVKKCFGIVADMNFLMICEYEKDGINPEIILYKKR